MSNMIQLLGSIPNNVTLACSGGPDSMAILAFLLRGRKNVKLVYFNHGTKHADSAQAFVEQVAHERNLSLEIGNIKRDRLPSESVEEYWRNQRYNFFNQFSGPLITGHHLDDVAEWWIFSSLNGPVCEFVFLKKDLILRRSSPTFSASSNIGSSFLMAFFNNIPTINILLISLVPSYILDILASL